MRSVLSILIDEFTLSDSFMIVCVLVLGASNTGKRAIDWLFGCSLFKMMFKGDDCFSLPTESFERRLLAVGNIVDNFGEVLNALSFFSTSC